MPPDWLTVFIDRSSWSEALRAALAEANIPHEAHRSHFPSGDVQSEVDDSEWLRYVADRGWIVLTRDKRIRYRINELRAMRLARLHVFVLTDGSLTARDTGTIVVRAYPAMVRAANGVEPPAFFSIDRQSVVRALKVQT